MHDPVRINPPIPVVVVDEAHGGTGQAHFVIDYGVETDLIWVVAMDKGGQVWSVENPKIRFFTNWTLGRTKDEVERR
jgi:hypothetical protein